MEDEPKSIPEDVTVLLQAWTEGEEGALAKLTPLIYAEMHRLARHYMIAAAGPNYGDGDRIRVNSINVTRILEARGHHLDLRASIEYS